MKSLLFTGESGFIGLNIMSCLKERYIVDTLSLNDSSTYNVNLAEEIPVFKKKYDIVLHAVGKAHRIPKISEEVQDFYKVNYQGTINLCKGLEKQNKPNSFIFISTVAVYGCESGEGITEECQLDADTHYGKSKIQAEEYLLKWCARNSVSLIILRPALLAGKNPPGNLGAMVEGIIKGRYVSIAGGKARKSMAMADDIGRLIPYCEGKSGIFNLCDDHHPTFRELEELISKKLNKQMPVNIPIWSAKCLAKFGDLFKMNVINTQKFRKITKSLTFSNEKIKKELNFFPSDVLTNFEL